MYKEEKQSGDKIIFSITSITCKKRTEVPTE